MPDFILGPATCQVCRGHVHWDGFGWVERDGCRHSCGRPNHGMPSPAARARMRHCEGCHRYRLLESFPLGKPRRDGTRRPMRYCDNCMAKRALGVTEGGRRRWQERSYRRQRLEAA